MERSFGIWHTKCFPKSTPPSQQELEDLCKKLGFKNITEAIGRIANLNLNINLNTTLSSGKVTGTEEFPVKFETVNATKVVAYTKFSAVQLNDGFTVHLRPNKPLAKLVSWDENDHEDCHQMELKCVEGGN